MMFESLVHLFSISLVLPDCSESAIRSAYGAAHTSFDQSIVWNRIQLRVVLVDESGLG